jgi:amino acid transporter
MGVFTAVCLLFSLLHAITHQAIFDYFAAFTAIAFVIAMATRDTLKRKQEEKEKANW